MYWRTPQDWFYRYAVDAEGRLILGYWEGDQESYVTQQEIETGNIITNERSNVEVPELAQWGTSDKTAVIGGESGSNLTTIDYDGQHYEFEYATPDINPEISNYEP